MSKKTAPRKTNPVKRFFSVLGPGLITGAADDDPSGIATYSIVGAQMGNHNCDVRRGRRDVHFVAGAASSFFAPHK